LAGVFGPRQWKGRFQAADDRVDHIDATERTVRPDEPPGATIDVWAMPPDA
jgi:hypothetical protein